MHGFLGTQAGFSEDFNLVIQIGMGGALLVGMGLARKKNFQAHKICQSSVMFLNLILIAGIMFPAFRRQVKPHLASFTSDPHVWVAGIHAGLGLLAEIVGVYIVLRAATNWLPAWLRFKHYKPWMRTELALWWVVILWGIGVYCVWNVFPSQKANAGTTLEVTAYSIGLTNFDFTPKDLTVPSGATVQWVDHDGRHKVVADDNSFESPILLSGNSYQHKFDHAGAYPYHCDFHGEKGGKDMAGTIQVK